MKIWVDDVRPAPEGYTLEKCVWGAQWLIELCEEMGDTIELIDLDHDAGDYRGLGGDFIKILVKMSENFIFSTFSVAKILFSPTIFSPFL